MVLLLHGFVEWYWRPTAEDSLQLVRRELEALWSDGADFGRHGVQVVRRPEVRYTGVNLKKVFLNYIIVNEGICSLYQSCGTGTVGIVTF